MSVRKVRLPSYKQDYGTEIVVVNGNGADLTPRDRTLLQRHRTQRVLALIDLKTNDLSFLSSTPSLRRLQLTQCVVQSPYDISNLKELRSLWYHTHLPRGLDLTFLSELHAIEEISLLFMPHIDRLPTFVQCAALKRIQLHCCKRLVDISSVATIPDLREISITGIPQTSTNLKFLADIETLEKVSVGLGSSRANSQFEEWLAGNSKSPHINRRLTKR